MIRRNLEKKLILTDDNLKDNGYIFTHKYANLYIYENKNYDLLVRKKEEGFNEFYATYKRGSGSQDIKTDGLYESLQLNLFDEVYR